jgi:hypothetical protein
MACALLFLLGVAVGFVFGIVVEWVASLNAEYKR